MFTPTLKYILLNFSQYPVNLSAEQPDLDEEVQKYFPNFE